MKSLQSSPDFEFYAHLHPIIRDPGWEIGYQSYGSINYLWHGHLTEITNSNHPSYRGYMVGIVVTPSNFFYCYKAIGFGSMCGDRLNIPNDTPHEAVYEAAKQKALEYFAKIDNNPQMDLFTRNGW